MTTPLFDLVETLPSTLSFGADLALRATIVLAIVLLASRLARRRSAATRHLVVTVGFAAIIALPLLMVALPDARLAVLPPAQELKPDTFAAYGHTESWKTGQDGEAATSASEIAAMKRAITSSGVANERAVTAATFVLWVGNNWQSFLLAAIALIPAILLGRILTGMVGVWLVARRAEVVDEDWMRRELDRASRRLSVVRPIRMLLSDRINVPLVWGFTRPVLILPAAARTWSRERFRVVVLHEVAHVRRFDVLALMIGRLATALYWFHPLSWVLERTGRRECERACDDLVLRSGARASDYADHLLGIAAGENLAESYASVTLAMARPSELEGRLVSILRAEGDRAPVSKRVAVLAALAGTLLVLPIATVRLAAKSLDLPPVEVHIAAGVQDDVVDAVAVIEPEPEDVTVAVENAVRSAVHEVDVDVQPDPEVKLVNHRTKKEFASEGEKWFAEAYELHNSDRFDEAIEAFEKAIENDYRVGTSMYNIACGYAMQGDADNAIRWLEDAFDNGFDSMKTLEKDSDLDPIRSDPRFRGLVRELRAKFGTSIRKDRFDAAMGRYQELRARGSDNPGEWFDVGTDLLRLRMLDDSIESLERGIALRPDSSATARYNLACAYALKGDSPRALDALEQSILTGFDGGNKMSNDPDLESIRGTTRFAELRTLQDDLSLWFGIKENEIHKRRDNWNEDDAFRTDLPRFEAVVSKHPQVGRAWFNLGYAALRAGNLDRSRTAFGRSLDLGYKRSTAMYNLACVEAVAGHRDEAFRWLYEAEEAGAKLGGLHDDHDLDNLRNDPRFDELVERMLKRTSEKERKYEEKRIQFESSRKEADWI